RRPDPRRRYRGADGMMAEQGARERTRAVEELDAIDVGREATAKPPTEALLRMENVSVSFGGIQALRDLSFHVQPGEIFSIIGPNGAGKTSAVNVISGFYRPDRGRILFQGQDRTALKAYEVAELGIARTFQNVALFRGMSVLDNIMTGRLLK